MKIFFIWITSWLPVIAATGTVSQADDLALPAGIKSSQDPNDVPLTPQAALKRIKVPEGFNVSLFAGEPHVRQPIAFDFDDRGRLWVAECYSYRTWKPTGKDRILIFEDTDNDGQFDKRKVFWNKGNYLTGLQLGFGGVWICNSPTLAFIPDRDGDDLPDSEPVVLLDGWSNKGVHNVLNGLTWGPDGWLYGCNGITAPSKVGKPGTPADARVDINCGIWRYHPTRHKFEVVAHGTTNPWGLDFDQYGQAFFTNCVIDHLWHLIPGAHYKRMFGEDHNPYVYRLMSSCSDHLHWAGKDWTKSRGGQGQHDELGGGHAHCGAMIYLGDNWPKKYRGRIFTCNIHGNRVNQDVLARKGAGYTGTHAADFLDANDPWFRGVELKYGPDGGVYVSDWTELGECHDKDGVHRDSGRIYKVVYGEPSAVPQRLRDLTKLSDLELVQLHSHPNQWFVRHARRLLQERSAERTIAEDAIQQLESTLVGADSDLQRLEVVWTLYAIDNLSENSLVENLAKTEDARVRSWAIRLLVDKGEPSDAAYKMLLQMAEHDPSSHVRLELASALQRLSPERRWELAAKLVAHAEDAKDKDIPLMIWYGIEPLVADDSQRALKLALASKLPLVRQFIARRAAAK